MCGSKQDVLELATLRYIFFQSHFSFLPGEIREILIGQPGFFMHASNLSEFISKVNIIDFLHNFIESSAGAKS